MTDPITAAETTLVNFATGVVQQILNGGNQHIDIPANQWFNALPHGSSVDQLMWQGTHRAKSLPWKSWAGPPMPLGGHFRDSNCEFLVVWEYGGALNGKGQYLSNVRICIGDTWDPSAYSDMHVSMEAGNPMPTGDAANPVACLPVIVHVSEHLGWGTAGAARHDYQLWLYGNGACA
jgi:hypothetical protein